jgi:arylsulfatase A
MGRSAGDLIIILEFPHRFVFIENDRFTEIASVEKKWVRAGPAGKNFEAIDVLPKLTEKAVGFVKEHADGAKNGKPFFLYLPLNSPHTPIVPTDRWKGKSGLGDYADFVMETDDAIGQVIATLDSAGLKENTLLIVTSDNGCSPAAKPEELEAKGHYPSARLRGYKSDIWDGGHRIPFIARWPGHVKEDSRCEQTICLTDLLATCGDILQEKLPDNAAEDSVSFLPALLGKPIVSAREGIVHHSIEGAFAIRVGQWKLEFCPGSGGWGKPNDAQAARQKLPEFQLYNMTNDISEKQNILAVNDPIVQKLKSLMEKYIADGRSTPGESQHNDAPIKLIKKTSPANEKNLRTKGD